MLKIEKTALDLRGLTLVVAIIAWVAGILLGNLIPTSSLLILIAACAALLALVIFWRDPLIRIFSLSIFCLLLGSWRYTIASPVGDVSAISASIGTGTLEIRGSVSDEPKLEGRMRILVVTANTISKNGGATWQASHGRIEVETLGGAIEDPYGANYGDDVELQGKLQLSPPYATPDIFASMIFPRISVSGTGGNPVIAALYHLRVTLSTIISQSLPQPDAALLTAILLGLNTPALKPLVSAFQVTGTVHLIVSSGFKVTLLAGLILASTRWLYTNPANQATPMLPALKRKYNQRRWLSSTVVILCIAAYTVLSGSGPAALRAGIMGVLLVIAPRVGRTYNVYTALAMCTCILTIFDPFVLWDVGFLLSFLGTLGIVILTPILQKAFKRIERLPFGYAIAEMSAVTIAAQIATLPITAITFRQISFIAPFSNILTVPFLSITIFIGILICVLGMLFAPLGIICGWIAWPLLWYINNIVAACAVLPGAFILVNSPSVGLAWCYYVLLCVVVSLILYQWPVEKESRKDQTTNTALRARRTMRMIQLGAALVIVLATGTTALAAKTDGRLTVSFLNVGPANQQPQGEAIFIQTPDGKNAIIVLQL